MSEIFIELAHFRYPTHCIHVSQHCDSGRIHTLKYNLQYVEWQHWEYSEWEVCKEYMIRDMPDGYWHYNVDPK